MVSVAPIKGVYEHAFMQAVIDLAHYTKWSVFHPFDSRRSAAGYPDLTLARDGRLVFAELKRESAKPTPAQVEWLRLLATVPGVEVYLWRPSDWYEIVHVLTERATTAGRAGGSNGQTAEREKHNG